VVRLRKWICGNYTVKGKAGDLRLRVDASFGLAARQDAEGMNELVARADAAMYEQKSAFSKQRSNTKRPAA
jgi:GGDEF domain-containing protein